MKKGFKKALLMLLSLVMVFTMMPLATMTAFADEATSAEVTFTLSNQGVLAKATDGTAVVEKPVTVTDLNGDGTLTYDEALAAAHESYNSADGFDCSDSGWVNKIWGEYGSFIFQNNGTALPSVITQGIVKEGDKLYTAIISDTTLYADWYTSFDNTSITTENGEEISLVLTGRQGSLDVEARPVSGAQIGIWKDGAFEPLDGVKTGEDGKATFTVDLEPGEYILSAKGSVADIVDAEANWTLSKATKDKDGNDIYGKTDWTTNTPYIGYTEKDYGEGPYPWNEIQWIEQEDFDAEEFDDGYLLYSGNVAWDCPITAPYAKVSVIKPPVELDITNNTGMFKAETAYLITEGNQEYLLMALSGTGYKELYKGKYEQAVENGDGSADNGNDTWIHFSTNDAGKYEFKIPLNEGESYVPIVAVSNSYYTKYLNGQNTLERAFYPRQVTIDREAKTIVTDDYNERTDFEVTSKIADFKVESTASTNVVGGPNSNGYSVAPTLVMKDTTYDKVTFPTVVGSAVSTAEVNLTDGKFAIEMKNAPNLDAFKDKTPIEMTFHVSEDAPYDQAGTEVVRTVTIDKLAKTIVIDGTPLTKTTELTVENKFNMFKPSRAILITENDNMYIELTYSSTSYDKSYAGTAKEAVLISDENKLSERSEDGTYIIPVEKTDEEFAVAFHSVKNKGWYDRTFKIDTAENKLITDSPGGAIVPDDYGSDWDEDVSAESTLGMFQIDSTKVTIENGEAKIMLKAGNPSRKFSKIALIEQSKTVEEKEAAAIIGDYTGDNNNNYIFEITLPVSELGKAIPYSTYQIYKGKEEWHDWSTQHYLTFNSAEVVNQLIEQIQIQKNDEYTEAYIYAAKRCWDALPEAKQGEDDGYFSDDTGDASLDDPLNTVPDKKRELLVVSFGTSFNDSRVATIGAVEKALTEAFGNDYAVRRAFTAQIIINHIWSRDNERIDNVTEAMEKAVAAGIKEMIVQPTHLMSGQEYDELKEEIDKYADKIDIYYAKPLLDSDDDKQIVAKAVVDAAVADTEYSSLEAAAADGTAFVFMGHGTSHAANTTYTYMQETMNALGYDNCFIGTVEGIPAATALPEVKKAVETKGYTKVVLRPLMVVAGDHANNDMAADEEGSWYYAFVNGGEFEVEGQPEPVDIGEGFGKDNVSCQVKGLGEIEAVQQLYVAHSKALFADYTAVDEALAKLPFDISIYTQETAQALRDAVNNVDRTKKPEEQAEVDAMAKAIEDALAGLRGEPGWKKDSSAGKWHYFNKDGTMATGWVKDSGKWYYMDAEGAMQTGWVKVSGKWYYFNKSGVMQTGWQKISNKWYYMKDNGAMASKEWVKGYYWINKDGTWTYEYKASWKKTSSGKWWFGDTSGWYAKNTTIIIGGKSYTFDAKGYMK